MDCRNVEPFLSAWADGQLSEAQAKIVRDHVAQCPGCWGELQALESVSSKLGVLRKGTAADAGTAPAGLLTGVRALPRWLVWVAVLRRWVLAGGGVAMVGAIALLLAHWSMPLPATLIAQGQQTTQAIAAGTTLVAQPGETVQMRLADGHGVITLQGPGALIVRKAALGRVRGDERLELDMPSGQATIRFLSHAPAHTVRLATPQARVSLTGTWVLVQADAVTTTVHVLEGEALLQSAAGERQARVPLGQMAQVQAGQIHTVPIPVDEWLTRRGVAMPGQTMDMQPTGARPQPLFHEAR